MKRLQNERIRNLNRVSEWVGPVDVHVTWEVKKVVRDNHVKNNTNHIIFSLVNTIYHSDQDWHDVQLDSAAASS